MQTGCRGRRTRGAGQDAGTGTALTVRSIVHWPSTRVPTYSTAVWPGDTRSAESSGVITSSPVRDDRRWRAPGRRARGSARRSRTASAGSAGGRPAQVNRRPAISASPSASLGPDDDLVRLRAHLEHEARACRRRVGTPSASPLRWPTVKACAPSCEPTTAPSRSTMSPGSAPTRVGEPAAGVAVRDEADVVAVGLVGDGEAARGRLGAHLGLRRGRAEREHRVRELLGGEHAEHVGLVLGPGARRGAARGCRRHPSRCVA